MSAVATLDAAIVDCQARDDVWWLPEVMRMRAAHEPDAAAAARLLEAAAVARAHGSAALLCRCERDQRDRGLSGREGGVRSVRPRS